MRKSSGVLAALVSAVGMLVVILDSKTAMIGVQEGIGLCLQTVIPSLFPLMILSTILTNSLVGSAIPLLRPIGKACGIPKGAEGLLIPGLLGGYPIGARCIIQSYRSGSLSEKDARRLIGFCNNAGPAFVFGICGTLFAETFVCFFLWVIQILSAIITGFLLPGHSTYSTSTKSQAKRFSITDSIRSMAAVCGWIIIFRVILKFLDVWALWLIPNNGRILLSGILEISNGCCALPFIQDNTQRFVMCSVLLSFGGLCVLMQTMSEVGSLGIKSYFWGKVLQTGISLLLAIAAAPLVFGHYSMSPIFWILTASIPIILILLKKTVAFFDHMIYNTEKAL